MAIDLSKLSPKELQDLIVNAESQIANTRKQRIQDAKAKVEDLLAKEGLTLGDLYPRKFGGPVAARSAVAPKYANPANPAQTWSGRGKRPLWFNEALKKGAKPESLEIGVKTPAAAKKAPAKKAAAKK
jgi:DNA-binding protein H-NS